MAAETLCHQAADLYGDALSKACFAENLLKQYARARADRKANAAGRVYVCHRRKPKEVHL
jgi:hypothetical protein